MRRLFPLLLLVVVPGCAPPDYVPVGLQVDLEVPEDAGPLDEIAGLRVCLSSDAGDGFYLFPRDPGTHLIPEVPGGTTVNLEIHGLDREPDEIDLGHQPAVLAWAEVLDAPVAAGEAQGGQGEARTAPFMPCTDDCPDDCSRPETLAVGESSIGLRWAPID